MKIRPFFSLLCLTVTLGASHLSAHAAPEPSWAADPATLSPQDAHLRAPVTLDARRQPLPEFARQIGEKSGVAVQIPEKLRDKLVSTHLQALPLSEVLRALSRLYGLEWSVSPQGYSARVATSELESQWLQLGDIRELQFRHTDREKTKKLTAQILAAADATALQAPNGIALSTQPDLVAPLRAEREASAAWRLLDAWGNALPWMLRSGFLHVEVPRPAPAATNSALNAPRFGLIDANGTNVATLGTMEMPSTPAQK